MLLRWAPLRRSCGWCSSAFCGLLVLLPFCLAAAAAAAACCWAALQELGVRNGSDAARSSSRTTQNNAGGCFGAKPRMSGLARRSSLDPPLLPGRPDFEFAEQKARTKQRTSRNRDLMGLA